MSSRGWQWKSQVLLRHRFQSAKISLMPRFKWCRNRYCFLTKGAAISQGKEKGKRTYEDYRGRFANNLTQEVLDFYNGRWEFIRWGVLQILKRCSKVLDGSERQIVHSNWLVPEKGDYISHSYSQAPPGHWLQEDSFLVPVSQVYGQKGTEPSQGPM